MPARSWTFTNPRGQQLHAVQHLPSGPAQAVLVFHHGYAEHVGSKKDVFDQITDAGIAVYTYDMHGHGQSEPKEAEGRALVRSWHHMVDDLCTFPREARQIHAACGQPMNKAWFLGGYSVGGMTAAHVAAQQKGQWAGLVLVAAALGLVTHGIVSRIQAAIAPLLMATVPTRKIVKGMITSHLNPDPAWVASYDSDPLCYHEDARVCTVYNFAEGIRALQALQPELTLPVYIVHATGDRITAFQPVKDFAAGLPKAHFRTLEGGYHDLLSGGGPLQRQYVQDIVDWINDTSRATAGSEKVKRGAQYPASARVGQNAVMLD